MKQKFLRSMISVASLTVLCSTAFAEDKKENVPCFESREGVTMVEKRDIEPGWPNVKCSSRTNGVLWWGDPFDGTIPMGEMPIEADYTKSEAVVKPREPQIDRNKLLSICTTACHNGEYVPVPKDITPRLLAMHKDIVPNSLDLQHGKGAIWCLNCHSATNRSKLIDHFGNEISFNQPQKLCGKCHGQVYRDWRDGIHGKRIGMWTNNGKKRWWTCTECHNPHDVQQGARKSGFAQLTPEYPPELPKGMKDAKHEQHEHGDTPWWETLFGTGEHH